MILDKDFKTPFCIGIFGKWGSGKTSFMHLLEKRLSKDEKPPYAVPVWFNPWRYQNEEHLIIPFLKTIENSIRKYNRKKLPKKIAEALNGAVKRIGAAAMAFAHGIKAECKMGGFGFEFDVAKAAKREEEVNRRRLDEAKRLSDQLSSIYYDIVGALREAVDEKSFRIVVFIDDLDRCLPDKAVELLEAIKLFLDIEGYLVIMGIDRDVVKKGISYRYRFFEFKEEKGDKDLIISPEAYLDKMIQLPIELPGIERGRRGRFITTLLGDTEGFAEHTNIIELGVGDNPRTLKRFINLLAFTVRLAETLKGDIIGGRVEPEESEEHKSLLKKYFIPLMYIKWTIIVFRFPKVYNTIKGNKNKLAELQKAARSEEKAKADEGDKGGDRGIQFDERLRKVLSIGESFPPDAWLIDRFLLLTESTLISGQEGVTSAGFSQTFASGDMVTIPKGKFLYGDEKIEKEIDYDYDIDVFPVTNTQYKEFLDDQKDKDVPFVEKDWAKPFNWDRETRTYPKGMEDHPVVLVSFNDATDYCQWRSEKEGKQYRLPTEEEWEKAGRGTDGRIYPWGDEFDKERCNTMEAGIGKTTHVNAYPKGASPYGCHDMAGNIWEWTKSDYAKGSSKVFRGGSWINESGYCRCAFRGDLSPFDRSDYVGFRCARI